MQQATTDQQVAFNLNTARLAIMQDAKAEKVRKLFNARKFSTCASETMPDFMPETEAEAVEWVRAKYQDGGYQFGLDNLMSQGHYRLQGWAFDFRPFLKKYVYRQYEQWYQCYAPNRTLLRAVVHGRIVQILEAK